MRSPIELNPFDYIPFFLQINVKHPPGSPVKEKKEKKPTQISGQQKEENVAVVNDEMSLWVKRK